LLLGLSLLTTIPTSAIAPVTTTSLTLATATTLALPATLATTLAALATLTTTTLLLTRAIAHLIQYVDTVPVNVGVVAIPAYVELNLGADAELGRELAPAKALAVYLDVPELTTVGITGPNLVHYSANIILLAHAASFSSGE
jgi:hypothetical protein